MVTIPTIDARDVAPGATGRTSALERVRVALATTGVFYLVGHGVHQETVDELLAVTRRFFDLPLARRREIEMINSPHFRGYTALGNERTQGRPDWREEVDIGAERPARPTPHAPPYWGLVGPNQWPSALPDLRPAVLAYVDRMRVVAFDVSRALAEALHLERDRFDDAFEPDPHLLLKLVRYPARHDASDRQGVGAHKDSGFLTFVLQDDRGGSGLQFFDGSGWIDVVPVRGAFVVNVGEALELATGHRVRATLHRVQSPPSGDYVSVPFFFNPRFDYVVEPIALDDVLPSQDDGSPVDPGDPIFAEYGYNALKSRLRSHRDVAERYYANGDPRALAAERT